MTSRIALVALAAILFSPIAASAQSPARTGAEDCAVLAVVGEEKMHWREQSPDLPMYTKSYGVDCDFKAMGIKHFDIPPLPPGPYYQGVRFAFEKPSYSPDGLQATVTYSIGENRSRTQYFFALSYCTARKSSGVWRSTGCKPGPIT